MRFLRVVIGLLLLPCAYAATQTVLDLVQAATPTSSWLISPAGGVMIGGFLLWILLYFTLPRPVRAYIFAHELTHALWAWLHGSRVSRFRMSGRGGSVAVEKPNVLIILAPYFFPLYTMILVALYGVLSLFWNMHPWFLLWLGAVGFTWGFHVTFTLSALFLGQSDLAKAGYVFGYTLIYLLNVLGLALWLVAVGPPTLPQFGRQLSRRSITAGKACARTAWESGVWVYNKISG